MSNIYDETEEVFQFVRRYFPITDEYCEVWYKLSAVSDASKWPNILLLCNLLFSLPFSNGYVESIFSTMNIIRTNRRCSLQGGTISDLLEIHSQGPELSEFSADEAVALWYEDSRRTTQNPRKKYKYRQILVHSVVKMKRNVLTI